MKPATRLRILAAGVAAALLAPAGVARAQGPNDDLPTIRMTDPNRDLLRLGVPTGGGDAGSEATDIARRDFEIVGLFRVLDPTSFPPALTAEGLNFSSAQWSQVGAQAVVKLKASRSGGGYSVEGRLYQVARGDSATFTRTYDGPDLRAAVHVFVNDVIGEFTGTKGVFGSRIVFAQANGKELASIGVDGANQSTITQMRSDSILPAISHSGAEVAFTSFMRGSPDLYVVSSAGGRARRVSQRPGMNSGAAWLPDGSLLATLSFEGSPDIYRLSAGDGKVIKRLTTDPAIDSSPSPSPDGAQVAFVSNRQGTPQIFVMPASGGAARRVTFQGHYNQTPRWNPRVDKPLIAFTGRDERRVFDIFVLDLRNGKVDRMTQNQGSNTDPAWSPDGRLLVYASSRGGLFVYNPETRQETRIWRGEAHSPSWGPVPKLAGH